MMAEYLICPFCGDKDFDAIGLKAHFFRWCEKFDEVESLEQEMVQTARIESGPLPRPKLTLFHYLLQKHDKQKKESYYKDDVQGLNNKSPLNSKFLERRHVLDVW